VTKAFFGPARISNQLKDAGASHCDIFSSNVRPVETQAFRI